MVKRKVKKRSVSKSKLSSRKSKSVPFYSSDKKINMVGRRLVFFLILFALSLVFYVAFSNELWNDFFFAGVTIFGFISVALFLAMLVLWFMKAMKKK